MTKKTNFIINIILSTMVFSVILFNVIVKLKYFPSITLGILGIQQLNNAWYSYKKGKKRDTIIVLISASIVFFASIYCFLLELSTL